MTWCDGCNRPHQQVSELIDDGRIQLLCGPCWRWADYWLDIEPKTREQAA